MPTGANTLPPDLAQDRAPRPDRARLEAAQLELAEAAQEVALGERQREVVVDVLEPAELRASASSVASPGSGSNVSKSPIVLNGTAQPARTATTKLERSSSQLGAPRK